MPPSPDFVAAFLAFHNLAAPGPPLAAPEIVAAFGVKRNPVFEARVRLHSLVPLPFSILRRVLTLLLQLFLLLLLLPLMFYHRLRAG